MALFFVVVTLALGRTAADVLCFRLVVAIDSSSIKVPLRIFYAESWPLLILPADRIALDIPTLGWSLLFGTVYPLPLWLQNLERKRLKFRLCARSLSFKDLHAKSREHGS